MTDATTPTPPSAATNSSPTPAAPQPSSSATAGSSVKKYVLIAEDDKLYGKIYQTRLPKEGIDVEVAVNGQLALEAARKKKPDLILLDIIMPVMDGFVTLKKLKEDPTLKDIPVVMMSNLGQNEDIERAKKLGAKEYFVKSNLSLQDVVSKIKSMI